MLVTILLVAVCIPCLGFAVLIGGAMFC